MARFAPCPKASGGAPGPCGRKSALPKNVSACTYCGTSAARGSAAATQFVGEDPTGKGIPVQGYKVSGNAEVDLGGKHLDEVIRSAGERGITDVTVHDGASLREDGDGGEIVSNRNVQAAFHGDVALSGMFHTEKGTRINIKDGVLGDFSAETADIQASYGAEVYGSSCENLKIRGESGVFVDTDGVGNVNLHDGVVHDVGQHPDINCHLPCDVNVRMGQVSYTSLNDAVPEGRKANANAPFVTVDHGVMEESNFISIRGEDGEPGALRVTGGSYLNHAEVAAQGVGVEFRGVGGTGSIIFKPEKHWGEGGRMQKSFLVSLPENTEARYRSLNFSQAMRLFEDDDSTSTIMMVPVEGTNKWWRINTGYGKGGKPKEESYLCNYLPGTYDNGDDDGTFSGSFERADGGGFVDMSGSGAVYSDIDLEAWG